MCIFCKIIEKEIPSTIIFEDEDTIVIEDVAPLTEGHMLVIPKKHYTNVIDTPPELFSKVMLTAQKVANEYLENSDNKGYNVIINNNEEANQAVFHLHVHLVYRKQNDDINYFSRK